MSFPTSPLRLLPTAATFVGWDSHPLEFRAFSRRTELFRESLIKSPMDYGQMKSYNSIRSDGWRYCDGST